MKQWWRRKWERISNRFWFAVNTRDMPGLCLTVLFPDAFYEFNCAWTNALYDFYLFLMLYMTNHTPSSDAATMTVKYFLVVFANLAKA